MMDHHGPPPRLFVLLDGRWQYLLRPDAYKVVKANLSVVVEIRVFSKKNHIVQVHLQST